MEYGRSDAMCNPEPGSQEPCTPPLACGNTAWREWGEEVGLAPCLGVRSQNKGSQGPQLAPTSRKGSKITLGLTAQKTLQINAAPWVSQAEQTEEMLKPKISW